MWSIRRYVTALLRNALRNGLDSAECCCWCEVWAPGEAGELVDSAHLDPETGVIEWESDMSTRDVAADATSTPQGTTPCFERSLLLSLTASLA